MINDSVIKAPTDGKIIRINFKDLEVVQVGIPVVTMVSENIYQVERNIYEGDISKINIGDPVTIEVVAIPNKKFSGNVSFIDVASKVIDSVIYYKVLIDIDNPSDKMKVGMTADVTITPYKKENVLVIPERAITDSKVSLIKTNEVIEERAIKTGLSGSNRMIEVLSGLEVGDKIIIPKWPILSR